MKRRLQKKIFKQMLEVLMTEGEISGKRARYLLHQCFKGGMFPSIGYLHGSRPKFNAYRNYILIPIETVDQPGEEYHPDTIWDLAKYGPKWLDEVDVRPLRVISDRERRLSRSNKISVPSSREYFRREREA